MKLMTNAICNCCTETKIECESKGDCFCGLERLESKLLNRLGFCGCGMPEESLKFIYELLEWIKFRHSFEGASFGEEWDKHWIDVDKKFDSLIESNKYGFMFTLFYFLDDKRITTHGGSVPGWLDDETFFNELKTYVNANERMLLEYGDE